MSLEERIETLIKAVDELTRVMSNEGVITTAANKPTRKRRTKAEMEAVKESNTDLNLAPTEKTAEEKPDPLAILDTPTPAKDEITEEKPDPLAILDTPTPAKDEDEITEEKLRLAGSELCEVGGEKGLEAAQKIITKAGFDSLANVTQDMYKTLYAAFKLAVKTWKK